MSKIITYRVAFDQEETCFREIEMLDTHTFFDFHNQIIQEFDLEKGQLASFYVSNDNWDKGQEITLMTMDFDDGSKTIEMSDTLLHQISNAKGQKLVYVYDFMNMLCFFIELSNIHESSNLKNNEYPKCTYSVGKITNAKKNNIKILPEDEKLLLSNMSKKNNPKKPLKKEDDIFEGFDDFENYSTQDDEDDFQDLDEKPLKPKGKKEVFEDDIFDGFDDFDQGGSSYNDDDLDGFSRSSYDD